jgi:hypothetical protein
MYIEQIFGYFPKVRLMYKFRQIIGWATVWATFSQTHLVTLQQIQHQLINFSFSAVKEEDLTTYIHISFLCAMKF